MSQADVADAVKRAASLLKTLIVMQHIPEQAEKKCDDESNHSNDDMRTAAMGRLNGWIT
jgi:S-ribosylhomocysteine lyase LuxS involved in autoinducer biosynthesis